MALLILARVSPDICTERPGCRRRSRARGGFLDAVGGGDGDRWSSSSLVASGDQPRLSIGSVIVAEFFVTIAVSMTFPG